MRTVKRVILLDADVAAGEDLIEIMQARETVHGA
jgi:hypothetical protein